MISLKKARKYVYVYTWNSKLFIYYIQLTKQFDYPHIVFNNGKNTFWKINFQQKICKHLILHFDFYHRENRLNIHYSFERGVIK